MTYHINLYHFVLHNLSFLFISLVHVIYHFDLCRFLDMYHFHMLLIYFHIWLSLALVIYDDDIISIDSSIFIYWKWFLIFGCIFITYDDFDLLLIMDVLKFTWIIDIWLIMDDDHFIISILLFCIYCMLYILFIWIFNKSNDVVSLYGCLVP